MEREMEIEARGVEWRWRMEYTKHIGVLRQF
jgi:hypothetical protein